MTDDQDLELRETPIGQLAQQFAQALADQNFTQATSYIAEAAKEKYSAENLQQAYLAMVDYGDSLTVYDVEALEYLEEWPEKQRADLCWIYVAIAGDGFGEAVSLVLTQTQKIRDIEWGRP